MTLDSLTRTACRLLLGGAVLVVLPFLAGCSGNDTQSDSSTTQQPSQSSQQQGQPGQMPGQTLSSSDVDDSQVQTAAQIASSIQMGTRADRMKMRKDMKEKYGNPQQMDSTQKAQARKEMRRRQMKMRKKQMKIMQEEAKKAGMDPQMFRQIMRSAQQDSTLQKRLRTAMKAQMQKRMQQRLQKRKQQGSGPSNP